MKNVIWQNARSLNSRNDAKEKTMFEVLLFVGGVAVGVIFDESIRAVLKKLKAKKDEVLDRD